MTEVKDRYICLETTLHKSLRTIISKLSHNKFHFKPTKLKENSRSFNHIRITTRACEIMPGISLITVFQRHSSLVHLWQHLHVTYDTGLCFISIVTHWPWQLSRKMEQFNAEWIIIKKKKQLSNTRFIFHRETIICKIFCCEISYFYYYSGYKRHIFSLS